MSSVRRSDDNQRYRLRLRALASGAGARFRPGSTSSTDCERRFMADNGSPSSVPGRETPGRGDPADSGGVGPRSRAPRSPVPEEIYEDEPPGACLKDIRVGRGVLVWSLALLAGTIALALGGGLSGRGELLPETLRLPLTALWNLVPVVGLVTLLAALFIRANQIPGTRRQALRGQLVILVSLAVLVVWGVARLVLGIDFASPAP